MFDAQVSITEKEKYSKLWRSVYKRSACAMLMARYIESVGIRSVLEKEGNLLEIGCGDGSTLSYLLATGYDCYGLDITLAGTEKNAIKPERLFEAPVWEMPFCDEKFDLTFSTDTLEHLPTDFVEASIKEIIRITHHRTIHCIATFSDRQFGEELHLTIKPIKWWRDLFEKYNKKGLRIDIIDRTDFLNLLGNQNGED
ncbi:MAG: class I SAM-dependent methyltransferase [Candidatus Omnitrophica bacterium]|nr:class I SAM-dependent methyltransferase [Candidatus Omnitrophota bacterium]